MLLEDTMRPNTIAILFCSLFALLAITSALSAAETSQAALAKRVASLVAQDEPRLVELFKHLHQHPELGFQEVQTAALIAKEFQSLGYETHTGIGKTGVVGIFKNGPGPVVMFRSDNGRAAGAGRNRLALCQPGDGRVGQR